MNDKRKGEKSIYIESTSGSESRNLSKSIDTHPSNRHSSPQKLARSLRKSPSKENDLQRHKNDARSENKIQKSEEQKQKHSKTSEDTVSKASTDHRSSSRKEAFRDIVSTCKAPTLGRKPSSCERAAKEEREVLRVRPRLHESNSHSVSSYRHRLRSRTRSRSPYSRQRPKGSTERRRSEMTERSTDRGADHGVDNRLRGGDYYSGRDRVLERGYEHPDRRRQIDSAYPATGNTGQVRRASISSYDPRRPPRVDTGSRGNNSPGNNADVDSGRASGSVTPRTTGPHLVSHQDLIGGLASVLANFTDHVSTMAALTVQREHAKKQQEKKEKEFQDSRKFHQKFPSLGELHENARARAEKELEKLDRQLKTHVAQRDKLAQSIGVRVMNASMSNESEAIGRLEKDTLQTKEKIGKLDVSLGTDFKEKWHSISNKANTLDQKLAQVENKASAISRLSQDVMKVNQDVKKILSDHISLKQDGNVASSATKAHGARIQRLEKDCSYVSNLRMEVDKLRAEVRTGGKGDATKLRQDLDSLKRTVEGDVADENGLVSIVAEQERRLDQITQALKQADSDLTRFDDDLDKLGNRITIVESVKGKSSSLTNSADIAGSSLSDIVNLRSSLNQANERISSLDRKLKDLEEDEEKRDEAVAEEVEEIKKHATSVESRLQVEMRGLTEVFSSLQNELAQQNTPLSNQRTNLNQVSSSTDATESTTPLSNPELELQSLRSAASNDRAWLKILSGQIGQLQEKVQEIDRSNQQPFTQLESELNRLAQSISADKIRGDAMQETIKKLVTNAESNLGLKNQLSKLQAEISAKDVTLREIEAKITEFSKSVQDFRNTGLTVAKLSSEVNSLRMTAANHSLLVQNLTNSVGTSSLKNGSQVNDAQQSDLISLRSGLTSQQANISGVKSRLEALTTSLQNLDDRFNTLSTEAMAKSMVHQLGELYPSVGLAQQELDKHRTAINDLQTHVTALGGLEIGLVNDTANNVILLRTELERIGGKLESLSKEMKDIDEFSTHEFADIAAKITVLNETTGVENSQDIDLEAAQPSPWKRRIGDVNSSDEGARTTKRIRL